MAHCNNVCGFWRRVVFLGDGRGDIWCFFGRCWDFLLRFPAFFVPCPKHGCYEIFWWWACWEGGESSWLCMWFEVAFIAGHGIFDQGASAFFSCVDCERSLSLFSYSCRCTFFVWDFLAGFWLLFVGCWEISLWDLMVFICIIIVKNSITRVHAFCYITCLWDSMLLCPYEISRDFRMSFHAFEARVVGCACSSRLPSLPARVFLIRALRPFFLALTVKEVCLFFLFLAGALFS